MSTRESRISRFRDCGPAPLDRCAAQVDDRLDARQGVGVEGARGRIPGHLRRPLGSRRTSLITSWPPASSAGTSAEPMNPEAPPTAIFTRRLWQPPACSGCQRCASLGFAAWKPGRSRLGSATACAPRLPLAPSPILFGLSFGVLADASGFGSPAAVVMSATTFAGAAQFAAISVLGAGGTVTAAILAAVFLNARYVAISMTVASIFPGGPAAAAGRVAGDRRRVVGALRAPRTVRVADPRRRRAPLLRALGRQHGRSGRSSAACSTTRTRSVSTRPSRRSSSRSRCRTCAIAARARLPRSQRRITLAPHAVHAGRRPDRRGVRGLPRWGSADERELGRRRGRRRRDRRLQGGRAGARRPARRSRRACSRSSSCSRRSCSPRSS